MNLKNLKRAGFTLIELLSVIAVIAVLAAILIPAIGKVRLNAQETKGLGNLRQVGMTYLLVAQGNGGILPSVYGDSPSQTWSRQINALLTQQEAEDYPANWSETLLDPSAIARGVISPENTSKWHFAPLGAITRGSGSSSGSGAAPMALRSYNRLHQHAHPARQILLADAGVNDPESAIWGDLLHGESFSWSGSWSGNVDVNRANEPIDPGSNIGGDIRWMDDTAKFFFLDGHVEKRHKDEVYAKNLNPLFP